VLRYGLEKYSGVLRESKREEEAEAAYERAIGIYREITSKPKAGAMEMNNYSLALSKCPFPRLQNASLALELAVEGERNDRWAKSRPPRHARVGIFPKQPGGEGN
jgi:hypothetical protein